MGVIDRLCALAAYCFVLEDKLLVAICTFPSTVTLLNGRAVTKRAVDDSVDRCLVSVHLRPVPYIPVSNRAVIWAEFRGCSTADTPVDVADFHCDLVVGRECSPLFRVVIDDRSVAIVLFP